MTGPISPVGVTIPAGVPDALDDRNRGERRQGDRRKNSSKALVTTSDQADPGRNPAKPASVSPPPPAAFAAQILGQPGKKRGLRGGPEVLDAARATYMSREYSGPNDRRPPTGQRKKTEI